MWRSLALGLLVTHLLASGARGDDKADSARKAAQEKSTERHKAAINSVLDSWHKAAADADEAKYFSYFASDAIFFGTDAKERWTRDEFRKWAKPFFTKGKAWNFKASRRALTVSEDGKTAWFDEALETPNLGPCRGTGVLVREADDWKIAQYHLCTPIPNEVFDKVKKIIDEGK